MQNPILDFTDDEGALLKSAYPTVDDLPQFVKEAELVGATEAADLDDGYFALVVQSDNTNLRKYAMVDLGNTFISALYLNTYGYQLPDHLYKEAAAKITSAFEAFGVEPPILGDREPVQLNKNASVYTEPDFNPAVEQVVTMNDAMNADGDFQLQYSNIDPLTRRDVAKEIVKMASATGYSPSKFVATIASDQCSPYAVEVIKRRTECTEDPLAIAGYQKIASILETTPGLQPDIVIDAVYQMDKRAGLTSRYGREIPEPNLAVMEGTSIGGMRDQRSGVLFRNPDTGDALTSERYSEMLNGGELNEMLEEDVVKDLIAAGDGGFEVLPISLQTAIGRKA